MDVWIAAGAQQIMHPASLRILAVILQAVPSDCYQRSQEGQVTPKPVVDCDMRCLRKGLLATAM